jgi:hypothetical protein
MSAVIRYHMHGPTEPPLLIRLLGSGSLLAQAT